MRNIFILIMFVSFLFSKSNISQIKEGRALYLEANCQKCHNQDSKFVPKADKSKNLKGLHKWVKSCSNYFEIQWFEAEEKQVVAYLNSVYYKYKK